ncbi:type VII secretion protein EssC [Lactovum odontotermitis]
MTETGFEIKTEVRKQTLFIHNRLDAAEVLFVVFLPGEKLRTVTLTESRLSLTYQGLPFGVIGDQLWIGGNPVPLGRSFSEALGQEVFTVSPQNAETIFFLINEKDYFVIGTDEIASLKTQGDSQVVIHENSFGIEVKEDYFYYNELPLEKGHYHFSDLQAGTQILTPDFLLEKRPKQWKITIFSHQVIFAAHHFLRQPQAVEFPEDFPDYRRSPRLHLEPPEDKFKIEKIEAELKPNKNGILRAILPPVGMLAAMGLVSVLSGRNPIMMLGMGVMSVITAALTLSQYFTEKKERKVQAVNRQENYDSYLVKVSGEIGKKYWEETKVLNFRQPSPELLSEKIESYDSRIYERMANHKDFLEVSLGTGEQPSFLSVTSDISARDTDENTSRVRKLAEHYSTQRKVPMPLSLSNQTLGLVGTYPVLKTAVENLLLQVAFFHSYRDVNFISLLPEKDYRKDWGSWRVLPHSQLQELGLRGLIHDGRTRDIVLSSFYQLLNRRKQMVNEAGKEKPQFSPHYIFTIFDDSYLAGHGINEFLAEDMTELGVTVIWAKEDQTLLPETVTALIDYKDQGAGEIINDHNIYLATPFLPYQSLPELERSLRRLANLHHIEVEKNAIPESLSLLEQYEVKTVEELNIRARWEAAEPNKSIKSLIGWRGKKEYMYWDLHERVHGPHALVGGTTGSGKSEFLTTYLIGLAINFSPEDIGMLIIDWKGGGIANTLERLPHFMGSITNLDGAGTERALASIRAELDKRMKEFAAFGVNNINAYMSLYKRRHENRPEVNYPQKPIPHLILVSDEFAELKSNVPEFLDELTSVARIGRSLGVHLILATQKPSGVVNDQIEANSRSKIALKMASEQDSNELLKTHDAAHLTQPGRGYLKVGENEVYDLFQSGYSGVPYDPSAVETDEIDERIYRINDLGQAELALDPNEEVVQGHDTSDLPTQLEAVIEEVCRTFEETDLTLPAKPWLPNLEDKIVTPLVIQTEERNLCIPLGLMDIPSQQVQKEYLFDLEKSSHTVIFSSPGYGKSTALQTLVMNLARQNTPEQVQFYLMDFGTNGLQPLKELPHVADITGVEETEKVDKLLAHLKGLISSRRQLFQLEAVSGFRQYEMKTGKTLPVIVSLLDGYDAVVEDTSRRDKIDEVLNLVLREGAGLGIYLILSANRSGAILSRMAANIHTNIALTMLDDNEYRAIFNMKGLLTPQKPGRGQILTEDQLREIQIYLANDGKTELDYTNRLIDETKAMAEAWTGDVPAPLPILPNPLTYSVVDLTRGENELILGYSQESTRPYLWNLSEFPVFLASIDTEEQGFVLLEFFLKQFRNIGRKTVLVDGTGDFLAYKEQFDNYISEDELFGIRAVLLGETENKEQNDVAAAFVPVFDLSLDLDDEETPEKEETEVLEPVPVPVLEKIQLPVMLEIEDDEDVIYYIPDLESIALDLALTEADAKNLMRMKHKKFIFVAYNNYLSTAFDNGIKYLRSRNKTGLFGVPKGQQKQVPITGFLGSEPLLEANEFYAYKGRSYEKIKLPVKEAEPSGESYSKEDEE